MLRLRKGPERTQTIREHRFPPPDASQGEGRAQPPSPPNPPILTPAEPEPLGQPTTPAEREDPTRGDVEACCAGNPGKDLKVRRCTVPGPLDSRLLGEGL